MAYYNDAKEEWDVVQEVARSAFADMLHDEVVNLRYKLAIEEAVGEKRKHGRNAHVVDIGTGPGLLTLLAVEAGADAVTTLEVFTPVAEIARQIFQHHYGAEYARKIELVNSRSTDLATVSTAKLGNILVAEVFDTELIGEGALRTFKEAHGRLVERGSRTIPSKARIWLMPIESEELGKFHSTPFRRLLNPLGECAGSASVFDLQLSELVAGKDFRQIGAPFVAFEFDFQKTDYEYVEEVHREIHLEGDSDFTALLMWWDLAMGEDNLISMAPSWMMESGTRPWRDHWMQSVYFLPRSIRTKSGGETIRLRCHHDEFSLWFEGDDASESGESSRPVCTCQLHATCPRSAIYRLNDMEENARLVEFISGACAGKRTLCIGEGSMLGLYIAHANCADDVVLMEPNPHFRHILLEYAAKNSLRNLTIVSDVEELAANGLPQLQVVVSELGFLSSLFEADGILQLMKILVELRARQLIVSEGFVCFPEVTNPLRAHFSNYHHIQRPMGYFVSRLYRSRQCPYALHTYTKFKRPSPGEPTSIVFIQSKRHTIKDSRIMGFDLSPFGESYEKAKEAVDPPVETFSLWEYEATCCNCPTELFTVDLTQWGCAERINSGIVDIECGYDTNALTFWTEMRYADGIKLSAGALNECLQGIKPKWHRGYRQGVHFLGHGATRLTRIQANGGIYEPTIHFHFEHIS